MKVYLGVTKFKKLKKMLISIPIIVHIHPKLPLRLITDATNFEAHAPVAHNMSHSSEKVIAYASQKFLVAEKVLYSRNRSTIFFSLCTFYNCLFRKKYKPL